jgi:hypothetical protein
MTSFRTTLLILLIVFLGLWIFTIIDYNIYLNKREDQSLSIGDEVINEITKEIDRVLLKIQQRTVSLADSISKHKIVGEPLLDLIEKECKSLEQILGVTVAFEPFVYDSKELYAPYYDKNAGKMIFLDEIYDYTDENVTSARWYVNVVKNGAMWIEPYYGQGAQAIVTDYGVPFNWEDPETGESKLAGTVTLTISLEDFTRLLNSLSLGKTGYGFIISPTGNFLAHPINVYVGQKNILDVAREHQDEVLAKVGRLMLDRKSGYEQFMDNISEQVSYLFYNYIPITGWNLGVVFIKNELLGNPLLQRKKLMHIGFSTSALLLMAFCLLVRVHRFEEDSFWQVSIFLSILIVANICYIWFLTLNYSFPAESEERYRIGNNSALNRFLNIEEKKAIQVRTDSPISIPTGIHINEIEFQDSYNVNISSTIWQKYDHKKTKNIKRAITFPQTSPFAEALFVKKEIQSKKTYDLVTWDVRGTYRLDFDYSTYPFDYRHLDLLINHPDRENNVILTPHLEGYKIVNQSSKPGVSDHVVLPESEVDASYFDYTMENYNSNFGMESLPREQIPQLHFNVVLKRKFINAFVSNIIPIFIVAMMLYFLIYGSSKKASKRSEISSIGVVESSAAFFFVLLLAHIDHRKAVNTPVITYMESFYFIMYIILAMMAFNIVMFSKKDDFLFFDYEDNLIVKIAYWPFFLGICLLVTLFRFY